jgi:hypothetical protein
MVFEISLVERVSEFECVYVQLNKMLWSINLSGIRLKNNKDIS